MVFTNNSNNRLYYIKILLTQKKIIFFIMFLIISKFYLLRFWFGKSLKSFDDLKWYKFNINYVIFILLLLK